ncbi:hypothetical protein ACX0G7_01410 [Flavitalea antarctica]
MKAIPILIFAILLFLTACEIMPRNTKADCLLQCKDSDKSKACIEFCDCIHENGRPLDSCLDDYEKAPADSLAK